MSLHLFLALSQVIWLGGILALFRYAVIRDLFHPFIWLLWLGCINESLSAGLVLNKYETVINNNFYVLAEPLMLVWFFNRLGSFRERPRLFPAVLLAILLWWLAEVVLNGSLNATLYYYRFFYASVVILLSILQLNHLLLKPALTKQNKVLLVLTGTFIFYFSFKVLVDAFWRYGLEADREFLMGLAYIFIFVNLIVNLVYALAVIWMPRKREF